MYPDDCTETIDYEFPSVLSLSDHTESSDFTSMTRTSLSLSEQTESFGSTQLSRTCLHPLAQFSNNGTAYDSNLHREDESPSQQESLSQKAFKVHASTRGGDISDRDAATSALESELVLLKLELAEAKAEVDVDKVISKKLAEECGLLCEKLKLARAGVKEWKSKTKKLTRENARLEQKVKEKESDAERISNLARKVCSITVSDKQKVDEKVSKIPADGSVDCLQSLKAINLNNENEQLRLENDHLHKEMNMLIAVRASARTLPQNSKMLSKMASFLPEMGQTKKTVLEMTPEDFLWDEDVGDDRAQICD